MVKRKNQYGSCDGVVKAFFMCEWVNEWDLLSTLVALTQDALLDQLKNLMASFS